jgi:hypothetical protein
MYLKIKLCLIPIFVVSFCLAQSDTSAFFKKGKYKVFVRIIESGSMKKKLKGYPITLNDSGLWMTRGFVPKKDKSGKLRYELIFIGAESIDRVFFRRNGRIGIGILLGSITGFFIGGRIGATVSNNSAKPNDALTVLAGVITGFYSGAVIGGITAGQIRKRFSIGGDLQNFIASKHNMTWYLPRNY